MQFEDSLNLNSLIHDHDSFAQHKKDMAAVAKISKDAAKRRLAEEEARRALQHHEV